MRRVLLWAFLFALVAPASLSRAQTSSSLPPGTSLPDGQEPSAPGSHHTSAASLIGQAEDKIVAGKYDAAVALLEKAIAAADATPQQVARAYYDRGYAEQQQKKTAAAEADFRKAIAADPNQFEAHAALGRLLAEQEKWTAARQELESAAKLQPASGNRVQAVADVDRMLARVDAQLGDPSAASDALLAALKLTPETSADTLLAAQLADEEHNNADAAEAYRKVLAENPKSIEAAEGLARALIHQQKFAEAETVLEKALQQKPNDPVLLTQSVTALSGQGKTDEAIPKLEALHRQEPNQPAVTQMLADLYSTGGHPEKAEPLYRQLLAANPKDSDLLTAQGENLMHLRKWSQAAHAFRQSLQVKRDQPDAWSGLAFANSEDGEYAAVLTALDNRAKYRPDVPATIFLRATALDHLHRIGEAVPLYRKFLAEGKGKFPDEEAQTRRRLAEIRNAK